ncbi:hypothetical protein [Halomonas litopenaei]|uniref:hypothetical protein n=1 Tax=Halomonas litopenaei TaxID=2109328 RepID=UPI001A8F17DA|nr:hypothetical protein [Halomonas litopenaei]MBN8414354.1 hypothetical protein [Halomonas litopenaei]
MRTQEEVDQDYLKQQRERKQAIAEQAKADNAKLAYPKDYRGVRYYKTQYSTYIVPDVEGLEGSFTTPREVHFAIDRYLLLKEKDLVSK